MLVILQTLDNVSEQEQCFEVIRNGCQTPLKNQLIQVFDTTEFYRPKLNQHIWSIKLIKLLNTCSSEHDK